MFRSLWSGLSRRNFDWLQIAVTTHCNASCAYCPHTLYQPHWQNRHLSLATFHRLVPDLKRVRLVYLQGWGEPFLHPDFFTFVSLAKQAGCQVGATTNGTLLTEATLVQIVESGMDILAFSLAGIGRTHDRWRQGTSFAGVLQAIHGLQECKRRLGKITPRVHIAYMLLRAGLPELEGLPAALQGLEIDQVVISTLDLVTAPGLARECLATAAAPEKAEITKRLEKLAFAGAGCNLPIHYPVWPVQGSKPVCPENVRRAAVVSATGNISPCVYTNLPVSAGDFFVQGQAYGYQPFSFGNLDELHFQKIWQQPDYAAFRQAWQNGKVPGPCQNCLKLAVG